jgi:hypothetical protein
MKAALIAVFIYSSSLHFMFGVRCDNAVATRHGAPILLIKLALLYHKHKPITSDMQKRMLEVAVCGIPILEDVGHASRGNGTEMDKATEQHLKRSSKTESPYFVVRS